MVKSILFHIFFIITILHTYSIAQDISQNLDRHLLKISEDLKISASEGHYEEVAAILETSKKLKTSEKSSALYAAAEFGHLLIVQLLHNNGAKLDSFEGNYQPIHISASKGYVDIVRYLLLNGVDVDVKVKKTKSTALLLAASMIGVDGIPDTVEVLLINGANINAKDEDDVTAFDMAVKQNDLALLEVILKYVKDKDVIGEALVSAVESSPIEVMEILIDAGANINIGSGKNGATALHIASITSLDKVNLLLKKKADVTVTTKDGETPLIYASGEYCDEEITSALAKKSNINKKNKDGNTALDKNSMYPGCKDASNVLVKNGADQTLFTAISTGDLNRVKEELDKGKYTYESLRDGSRGQESPLILASYLGEEEIVDYLLSLGANVNVEDSKAVVLAVEEKHFDIVKTLINEGVALPSDIITTFLKFEPYCEGAKTIKFIIEDAKYIELDLLDAMILAIKENCEDIVEVLLDAGINADSVDNKNNKIITYATDMIDGEINPRKGILKILVKAGAEQDIYIATLLEDTKAINSFIKNNVNVDKAPNSKLSYGQTALWAASHLGYTKLIEPLVDGGADLEVRDKYFNHTPLLGALINEHFDTSEELIAFGADIDIPLPASETEIGNNSTLIYAILQSEDELVKTLISEGIDLDAQNSIGETALIIATKTGESSLVCELLTEGADSTLPDYEGNTPTYVAASESQFDIIKIYLSESSGNKDWETYC